jgi:aryl-alcohol dehydrogenase-like predicted oxidoreductase
MPDKEFVFRAVDKLSDFAREHNASIGQIAFAWLLNKPVVATILVGPTKRHELEEYLEAVDIQLTAAEVAELDAMTVPRPLLTRQSKSL